MTGCQERDWINLEIEKRSLTVDLGKRLFSQEMLSWWVYCLNQYNLMDEDWRLFLGWAYLVIQHIQLVASSWNHTKFLFCLKTVLLLRKRTSATGGKRGHVFLFSRILK